MEEVSSIQSLKDVWTIAYVVYPKGNACFAYPQYAITAEGIRKIPASVFRDAGSIGVSIVGYKTYSKYYDCDDVLREFGKVVAMRINGSGDLANPQYTSGSNKPVHWGQFNPTYRSGASEIEFQKLWTCSATRHLLQVVELEDSPDLHAPFDVPVELVGGGWTATPTVIVECIEGQDVAYYGPFEAETAGDGLVRLSATEANSFYVTRLPSGRAPEAVVVEQGNDRGGRLYKLMSSSPFVGGRVSSQDRIDWVSDEVLIEKAAQALKAAKVLKGCTPGEFKKALKGCRLEGIYAQRKARMEKLAADPDYWERFGDTMLSVMTRPEMADRVVALACDDRFLPSFASRLVDTEGIKREAERARREAGRDLAAAKAELERVNAELARNEERNAELDRVYQEERARAEGDARRELESIRQECDRKASELERVSAELQTAESRMAEVRGRMEGILGDREALAADLLRDSVVRCAIEQASGTPADKAAPPIIDVNVAMDPDEEGLSDAQVVERVKDALADRAGRDLSFLDTLNLLVCMVQSPLTILSGLPGTGKTSLARALAGSLGLVAGGRRFVEIGVERGWTSQRDWTGYYNPIMSQYEKTDPMAFDAVFLLDAEARAQGCPAPFLFLLDEMNLSPAEYYWGPFLRAYDTYGAEGAWMDLGGPRRLNVPAHVRFVATANFDHTTDSLSPRLLDRAWVVRLDPFEVDFDDDAADPAPDFSDVVAFSWRRLKRAFGADPKACMAQSVREPLKRVLGAFASNGVPVSVRAQNMMRGYITTMARFLDGGDPAQRLSALDLAVAQKVLPQVAMAESPTAQRLFTALADVTASLPTCTATLKRIQQSGAQNGFYSYFA